MDPESDDDAFAKTLRQLAPNAPDVIKAKLLYECGVSAAKAKSDRQKRNTRFGTLCAVVVAAGVGAFANEQIFRQPTTRLVVRTELQSSQPVPAANHQPALLARSSTTLTAASSVDRVNELLQQDLFRTTASSSSDSNSATPPFGTLSYPGELH